MIPDRKSLLLDSIISSSFMDVQGLHNWIKNWTLSARPVLYVSYVV